MLGVVKFHDAGKGFGFVVPDEGGRDVYLSVSMRNRAGPAADPGPVEGAAGRRGAEPDRA